MSKQTYFLVSVAVLLGAAYVYFFTDWFRAQTIQIIPQIRPGRSASRLNPDVYPGSFLLDDKYPLKSVKVVRADDAATNRYPHALWHMITESNSAPTKFIVYGAQIKGMKPSVPKARPEPLQPHVPYQILVDAGKTRGTEKFMTKEIINPAGQ